MTNDLIKYLIEQSSGIVIAIILIVRIEHRMDELTASINRLAELVSGHAIHDQQLKSDAKKDTTNF